MSEGTWLTPEVVECGLEEMRKPSWLKPAWPDPPCKHGMRGPCPLCNGEPR